MRTITIQVAMQSEILTRNKVAKVMVTDDWETRIRESYAHNSRVYAHLAEDATREEIVTFLCWDAHQPAFSQFLNLWTELVPASVESPLREHIAEEEEDAHAALFTTMLKYLLETTSIPEIEFDENVLERLNYIFSSKCAQEQNAGFFLGGFLATELMSQKRCQQIWDGLRRIGIHDNLEYLSLHAVADGAHYREVYDTMVRPALEAGEVDSASIGTGIDYRLKTSGDYLRWYADTRL